MSAPWRLAINNLFQRRSRSALLVASVALCAALITAIACAMASLSEAVRERIAETVGAADVRVQRLGGGSFEASVLDTIERWPEVAKAVGRGQESVALRNARTGKSAVTMVNGVLPERESALRPPRVKDGRTVKADGEIVLQKPLNAELDAVVGDTLTVEKFGQPVEFRVVGIQDAPPLSAVFQQTAAVSTLADLARMTDKPARLNDVDIQLRPGVSAEQMTITRRPELPAGMLMQTTAKITSGLDSNIRSNQIGFLLASVLTFLAAAFIITTGLTTSVTERVRELAILRSIGAFKGQLARAQLLVGVIVGGLGALVGVPLGVAAAALLVVIFPEQLPGGFALSWLGVALGIAGALGAGLIGAAWPAVTAARVTPMEGLSVRARALHPRWVWACLAVACALLAVQAGVILFTPGGDATFYLYILLGLPCLMGGYFLLSVPVTRAVSALISAPLSRALGLPGGGRMLARTFAATPYRHGFTAGAMMLGLAMMVAIWTNGRAVMVDWLDALEIPDAFVAGINLKEETQRAVERVPGVATTCAVTVQTVGFSTKLDAESGPIENFGITGLTKFKTNYIAFEPGPFFRMTKIHWVQGDPKVAIPRLMQGNAILVAREFVSAHGIGVGDQMDLRLDENAPPLRVEVVGVVTSPGLDIVSKFYDIGEGYEDQALNAVFGPRRDLVSHFHNSAINLIQIGFAPDLTDDQKEAVLAEVRAIRGAGILQAGSSHSIKARITEFIGGSLFIASVVAIGGMVVACFAVANLIIAGVQARQFEFGVLRAVGAPRALLGRMIIGEALIIGLSACVLGSLMGLQGAWGGQKMYEVVIGLDLTVKPPVLAMALGCVAVLVITTLAAAPTAVQLVKRPPRELLAAVKG